MKRLWEKLCKSNDGFSLVELIAIMGVLAVLFGLNSLSLAIQPSTEAKKVTYSIDAMFTRTKVGTLAKSGNVYMELHCDSTGKLILYYYEQNLDRGEMVDVPGSSDKVFELYDDYLETEVLTKYGASVEYSIKGGSIKKLGAGESLIFGFDRRTMGFLTLEDAAKLKTGATAVDPGYCDAIYVSGGTATYTIKIGTTTGTHTTNLK